MLRIFIDRPVLSTVISILIVVLGIIGLVELPVEQYPNIAPPTIQISATYSGANADVVMKNVIIPIEEQVNGVEGMTYMMSTASNNGTANITVYFKQGINPDIAAVNVQNMVARATPLLPQEVVTTGVTVKKQQTSTLLFITLKSNKAGYDRRFIQNYANINILPQIRRVFGVGDASIYGFADYSMRIWFNPHSMAIYQLNPTDVIAALQDQNIEAAPGQLGANSDQAFQYTLKYSGRYQTPDQFGNIIIRSINGQVLRIKDVATVELGSLDYGSLTRTNGHDAVVIPISQTPGSNAQEVIENVKAQVSKAAESFPPGLEVIYLMDANEFLNASINKVLNTLVEAFLLVFLVVFVFLQDFKSTIIPGIAVPVAIIGTFFFLEVFGFSINLLTLFALVLAIGIVVDDAIVVVEAVHAQMDAGERNPRIATIRAMKEIAPAIVSITLVMSAVFIPVSFIGGTSGVFYKQFGLTLAIAIMISAVNALTLTPALCALFLKSNKDKKNRRKSLLRKFYFNFNVGFNATTKKYRSILYFLGRKGHGWITVTIIAVSCFIFYGLISKIPKDFVPVEDGGFVMGIITLPPGSSLERSDSIAKEVVGIADKLDAVEHVTNMSGISFMSGAGSSYASLLIKLKPWDNRKQKINDVVAELKEKTAGIKDATFFFFGRPTLQGFGLGSGVELKLQDKTGGDILKFYNVTSQFLDTIKTRKEVMMAMTTFNPNFPQKQIDANIAKIKDAGMTLTQVMTTLQAYIGSMYVSNFNQYGKQFRVMVQASPEFRSKMDDLNGIFVKTGTGEMAPITEFITITDITGPQSLTRFNLYSSMDITIIPNYAGGYSSGDIIKMISEISPQLPDGYAYEFSGISREQANSGSQTLMIFALCLVFVYLLLAALYESYILPLAVIFSLPIGLAGVFIFIFVGMINGSGIINNIYVQISLIMLIGLLSKNAILIVEYALQRRRQGMSIVESAVNGAVARLRPILMTSFAFIFGLLPLMFSSGAGAIGNRSIGISAVGGMLIGTIFGVLVIPSLFIIFQSLQEKITKSGVLNTEENTPEEIKDEE